MKIEADTFDAILIPGGGVRENGELPPWTQRRLERAIAIGNCRYFITLSAGTTHKPPPLDRKGFPIFESVAAANYLIQHGVEPHQILYETSSYDTIGNAYFAKVIHIDPLGLSKLLIITSEFHMERTKAIFEWIYSSIFSGRACALSFETVSDRGLTKDSIAERRTREKNSLRNFHETRRRINNLTQLHDWLFNEHRAYSANRDLDTLAGKISDTY
ncbi:MAG: YdcF family protein [Cyanobacteria bacterium J06641_5]